MIKKKLQILNKHGLHARPAALLVRTTGQFKSDVKIMKDGLIANGKSIMGVMTLAAEPGSDVEITVTGEDALEAMKAIEVLIENKFYEE